MTHRFAAIGPYLASGPSRTRAGPHDNIARELRHGMKSMTVTAIAVAGAVLTLGVAGAAVHAQTSGTGPQVPHLDVPAAAAAPAPVLRERTVWIGADLDHDGQPDIADPTGAGPRGSDAYGEGRFHARRDGGEREHEGVDYIAKAGQPVEAPISGFVTRVGFAYPDDQSLKYVEIENPALKLTARVFYVDPEVAVGQSVAVGHEIGHAHSLQRRYPLGITDHVHLELVDRRGRKLDAGKLIVARNEVETVVAAD
jgi:murein DD-endopeptidase MepM/ murein hydrolase activator NlpD